MDVEELGCGLEVGAGETGVGVRAVLLGWAAAVAVGEAVVDPRQVVLDPFRVGGGGVGVVRESFAGGVDPAVAVALEGVADGGVVDLGVAGGHARTGVAEQFLDDVLRDAGVDEPGPDGVTELVGVDSHGLAGLVAHVDLSLPVAELAGQAAVGVGLGPVVVVAGAGEQPRRPVRPWSFGRGLVGRGSCRRLWRSAG